jgi:L-asparagine transporter-like permease
VKERVTLQITLISAIFLFYFFPNGIFNFRCSFLLGVWLVGWLVVFRKALGYSNGQDKNHPPEKERFKRRYTQLLFYFFVQLLFYFKYNGIPSMQNLLYSRIKILFFSERDLFVVGKKLRNSKLDSTLKFPPQTSHHLS